MTTRRSITGTGRPDFSRTSGSWRTWQWEPRFGSLLTGVVWPLSDCQSKPMGSHFGVGAPPLLVYFSKDWDVHWGYGVLTHGQVGGSFLELVPFLITIG